MYDKIFEDLSTIRKHFMNNGNTSFDEASVMELLQDVHSENSQNAVQVVLELLNIKNCDTEAYKNTDKKDEPNFLSSDDSIIELEVPKVEHPCIDLTSNSPVYDAKSSIKIEDDDSNASISTEDTDNQMYDSPSPETSFYESGDFKDSSNDWEKAFSDLFNERPLFNNISGLDDVIEAPTFDVVPVPTDSGTNDILEQSISINQADGMQVLEENNNDPNNNMNAEDAGNVESMFIQAALDAEDMMLLLDSKDSPPGNTENNAVPINEKNTNNRLSPKPGCSKDNNDSNNCFDESMYTDSRCIQEIIPWAELDLILLHLNKHKNVQNRKEVTLWSLMKENPTNNVPVGAPKRKSNEDESSSPKKMCSFNFNHDKQADKSKFEFNNFTDNGLNGDLNITSANNQEIIIEENNSNSNSNMLPFEKDKMHDRKKNLSNEDNDLRLNSTSIPKMVINMKNKSNIHIRPSAFNPPSCTITSASLKENSKLNIIKKLENNLATFVPQSTVTSAESVTPNPQSAISILEPATQNHRIKIAKPESAPLNSLNSIIRSTQLPILNPQNSIANTRIQSYNPRSTITSASVPIVSHVTSLHKKPAAPIPFPAPLNFRPHIHQLNNHHPVVNGLGNFKYNNSVPLNSKLANALPNRNASTFQPINKEFLSNNIVHTPPYVNFKPIKIHDAIKISQPTSSGTNSGIIKTTVPPSTAHNSKREMLNRDIYYKLRSMFPDVDSNYIRGICENPPVNTVSTDKEQLYSLLVDHLLQEANNHLQVPNFENVEDGKKIINIDEQYEHLLAIFPDADPTYIRQYVESNKNKENALEEFIQTNLGKHNYPTKEEYLAKIKMTEQRKQYTTDFKVEKFLEIFPDPFSHFENDKRKCIFDNHALEFLKSYFNKHRVNTVYSTYKANNYNISLTAKVLSLKPFDMKSKRAGQFLPPQDDNIPLLQEEAFVKNMELIKKYISDKRIAEEQRFKELEKKNELLECQCCFNDKCMPEKCNTCIEGHIFCFECIIRGTDSVLSQGETVVKCFTDCNSEFSLTSLQNVLPPTKFSTLLQKRQAAEVIAAGVDGLVSCPFCHFASIPPPEDKVFKCLNTECMKESCRLCKEINHIPFKCGEQEKSDKARLLIEEKMTQALIRTCYKCKRQFFKEEGCNKMTCPCGAIMCYVCDQPVTDYKHFNAQGVNDKDKCPLWIDDKRVNALTVRKIAEETKNEILKENPHLKIDTQSLLPALPAKRKGPHDDIMNANEYAARVRTVGNLHKRQ